MKLSVLVCSAVLVSSLAACGSSGTDAKSQEAAQRRADFYAIELMERLGLSETGGALRIGFCHYNTEAEVDRVVEALVDET